MTPVCGLLGEHLGHSYSPQLHALLGTYEYRLYERPPEGIEELMRDARWTGLNVTIPHKRAVIPFMDELSPAARQIGSVNTILRRKDGTLFGDNTDVYGFERMLLRSGLDARGKKTLVLGTGGASSAVLAALGALGARCVTISRSGENNYGNLERHADARLIVNATPVGMFPNNGAAPLELTGFKRLEGVLDLIYNPARTALLMEAQRLGIPCMNGLYMLVSQAARSSELFTGNPIPEARVEAACRQLDFSMRNIALIGMPGAGKSSAARALGLLTGREVRDCDEEIAKRCGETPAGIITTRGEDAFRRVESDTLRDLGKLSGTVIATGGGAVTREENYAYLHQNSVVIWLRRDLTALSAQGRPLSEARGVEKLFSERKALYERFADASVEADSDSEQTARAVLSAVRAAMEVI